MTIQEALVHFSEILNKANIDIPSLEVEVMLCHILKKDKVFLYTYAQTQLSPEDIEMMQTMIDKRKTHYPLAYLLKQKEFYHRTFFVDERVLIPRPETELLVSCVIEYVKDQSVRIADIGTGSGCIAITLNKELKNADIFASDISQDALDVAQQNAKQHDAHITFCKGHLLHCLPDIQIVVANLPYVKTSDVKNLLAEPSLALDGNEDGLAVYEELFLQFHERQDEIRAIFLEIGFDQAEYIKQFQLFYLPDFTLDIKEDYAGHDRIAIIEKPLS